MIKRFFLIFSAFILSVAGSLGLFVETAKGASIYDTMVVPTTTIHSNYEGCTNVDLTNIWASTFLDPANWSPSIPSGNRDTALNAYATAFDNGVGWAVTQWMDVSDAGNAAAVVVTWTADDSATMVFQPNGGSGASPLRGPNAYLKTDNSSLVYQAVLRTRTGFSCQPQVDTLLTYNGLTEDPAWGLWPLGYLSICDNGSLGYGLPSPANGKCGTADSAIKVFFVNAPVVYPSGYEGPEVPSIAGEVVPVYPSAKYVVNNKDIEIYSDIVNDNIPVPYGRYGAAKPDGSSCDITGGTSRYLAAFLYDCDELTDDYPVLNGTSQQVTRIVTVKDNLGQIVKSYDANFTGTFKFSVPATGVYTIEMVWAFRGSNDPLPSDIDVEDINYVFGKLTFVLNVNGENYYGDTISGPSQDFPSTCTVDGADVTCDEPNLDDIYYEDCSTYGTDIGGYFQCIIRNFGAWLVVQAKLLFIPNEQYFNQWTGEFSTWMRAKLGFVYTSFSTITSLFGGIITNGATGTCNISPEGELFGEPININVCQFQSIVGNTVWALIQGVIISLTALALLFTGLRKYHEVVDQR